MTPAWPPRSIDHKALVVAYTNVLSWPLHLGGVPVTEAGIDAALDRSTHGVWSVLCEDLFDAVVMPADAGRKVVLAMQRGKDHQDVGAVVPCLLAGSWRIFFVQARTGSVISGARVLSAMQRVALPPTEGSRWEVPPWSRAEPRRIELPNAQILVGWLSSPPDAAAARR
ncbi:hypothetical protein [Streptomyces albipurpureus]|uniref:Uncharacterized protein n=1 Tax=Streptomyces albipurpureus TaxID=2897419 RepID=A0ABT0UYI1_9ACTN|nr:hypothetical protein [Streptomyces sp. CWNU-1]MCM2393628.1 hypothetical protein [Streptomyces sp. CWNU-1]